MISPFMHDIACSYIKSAGKLSIVFHLKSIMD